MGKEREFWLSRIPVPGEAFLVNADGSLRPLSASWTHVSDPPPTESFSALLFSMDKLVNAVGVDAIPTARRVR